MRASAVGAAAVALVLVLAGCSDDDGDERSDGTTATTGEQQSDTVARDGDPEFCAALVDFQERVTTVSEPPPTADAGMVEDFWNSLAEAEGRMIEHGPEELQAQIQQVAQAFDQFRIDAEELDFEYETLADLPSSESIDPGSSIAAGAAALFTYGDERCPLVNTG